MTRRLLTRRSLTILTALLILMATASAQGPSGPPGGGTGPIDQDEAERTRFFWKTHRVPGCGKNGDALDPPCPTAFDSLCGQTLHLSDQTACVGLCTVPRGETAGSCNEEEIGDSGNLLVNRGPDWGTPTYPIADIQAWDAHREGKCKRQKLLWCLSSQKCVCTAGWLGGRPRLFCRNDPDEPSRRHGLGVYAFSANGDECRVQKPWGFPGEPPADYGGYGDCWYQNE